ncbi:ABC-type transport auxiliary lipoprotein family protein [Sphingomonas oryzagri]
MIGHTRILPALALLLMLPGCLGGALRGGKPDDLYRFGAAAMPPSAVAADTGLPRRTLTLLHVHFAPEVADDRLLAARGTQTMYIKGVRWIAPAPDLFSQALERMLQARAPEIQLAGTQNAGPTGYALDVAVTRFEAHYGSAATDTPVVAMEGSATLYAPKDRHVIAFQRFAVAIPAAANRAPSIVAAFDAADTQFTADLADWVRTGIASNDH